MSATAVTSRYELDCSSWTKREGVNGAGSFESQKKDNRESDSWRHPIPETQENTRYKQRLSACTGRRNRAFMASHQ